MNKQIIEVPINVRYISEWNDFNIGLLKGHSIINKTITGCGFTHYCLTNNIPTILCSPRKFLLENKHKQLKHTYLVINNKENNVCIDNEEMEKIIDPIKELFNNKSSKKSSKNNDYSEICLIQDNLRSYILNCQLSQQAPKILVTYDSLKYIIQVLSKTLPYYSIIVDEFQNIFMDASFKASTELDFINTLQDCPNVTYLSATPYIEEYLNELDEFKDLPYYELTWNSDRLQTIKVDSRKTHHLGMDVDKIIQDYLQGHFPEKVDENGVVHQSKEVVFYTNSVKFIISTIKRNNLTPDQVNIICADTERNKKSLEKLDLSIGTAPLEGEVHKMFTFCTRTTYAGADFYSTCALSVIISDCKIDSLSTDIRMDFPQIMGRQRLKENVFRDECIFIYKLSDIEVTVDEFEKRSKEKLDRTTQDISNYQSLLKSQGILGVNRLISDYRLRIRAKQYKEDYTGINEKTGEPIINRLVYISERRAFELRSDVYKNEVQVYNEFAKIMSPISREFQLEKETQLNDLKLRFRSKGSFEDKMRDHCDVLLSPKWFGYIHISDFHWLPLDYRNYLNSLGPIRIKEINCREKEILREINNLCQSNPIKNLFIESFQLGSRFTLKSIKEIVRKIYNELGVIKTPKATDILEYFEVKPVFIYDSLTKKQTKGYEIIKIKE